MFFDYYAILEIDFKSEQSDIKSAFKNQALKWHPDKNPGIDTTKRMQLINEAYLILKDPDARQKYDQEYCRYQEHIKQQSFNQQKEKTKNKVEDTYEDSDYVVFDETLLRWMSNAREQAVELAKQTIEDLQGMSKDGCRAIIETALSGVLRYLIFGLIFLIFIKACKN
jgi:DnaJ-class molecular chaperone